jgi:hypothetical protein
MQPLRMVIAVVLVSAALIAVGWMVGTNMLWRTVADLTVPWLCSALALALLIVGAVSAICDRSPASIPRNAALLTYLGVVVVLGTGIAVDAAVYRGWTGLFSSLAEWLGFAVILLGCFWIPRLGSGEAHLSPR